MAGEREPAAAEGRARGARRGGAPRLPRRVPARGAVRVVLLPRIAGAGALGRAPAGRRGPMAALRAVRGQRRPRTLGERVDRRPYRGRRGRRRERPASWARAGRRLPRPAAAGHRRRPSCAEGAALAVARVLHRDRRCRRRCRCRRDRARLLERRACGRAAAHARAHLGTERRPCPVPAEGRRPSVASRSLRRRGAVPAARGVRRAARDAPRGRALDRACARGPRPSRSSSRPASGSPRTTAPARASASGAARCSPMGSCGPTSSARRTRSTS